MFHLRELKYLSAVAFLTLAPTLAPAKDCSIVISDPKPPPGKSFDMGTAKNPDGSTITLDSSSLMLDGRRWMPAMGEFHYSRYPESEWREELLKMKAGGIDVVSTYVFWIHHEEIEGQFDWTGRRDLRRFVQLSGELGLKVFIRCGPWDHGEVRNGGLPDWILTKGWETRSDDTNYLNKVKIFFGQIANQVSGLLWKDGGPVIGIQLENEYNGPAQHLLTLKRMACEAGLDVPIYSRTGWPALRTSMPFGEFVPSYGVYAEGFWDRELTTMPNNYWAGFHFSTIRTEKDLGADITGRKTIDESPDAAKYPFLTCEIGGGMMSSYHRRIVVNPLDSETTTLIKLGSGGASVGYYMYHGGENPDGKLTTLMESQATGFWNDMPVKNYDFQTAIGEYGQLRPQYHLLRRLHLFLQEWGSQLAGMSSFMPPQRPRGRDDFDTLRWAVRSDGRSGFVFVSNYQRAHEMTPKDDFQFTIQLSDGPLTFPQRPYSVPANDCFIWPFNMDFGGIVLDWATAQPVTAIDDGALRTVFFAAAKGVPPQFAFDSRGTKLRVLNGHAVTSQNQIIVEAKPGNAAALKLTAANGKTVQIVVLDEVKSLDLWKGNWQGKDRVFLTHAGLVYDKNDMRLTSTNVKDLSVGVYPAPDKVGSPDHDLHHSQDGIFRRFTPSTLKTTDFKVLAESCRVAGPLRGITLGKIDRPVAAAPLDVDFENAAVWRIHLPTNLDMSLDPILRLHYVGDVARVTLNGRLLTDDFYNGNVFEVGLRRYAPDIQNGDLQVAILPLRKDAPIYLADKGRLDFGSNNSVVRLESVELVPRYQLRLTADSEWLGSKGNGRLHR
jgi:hypothetical protein